MFKDDTRKEHKYERKARKFELVFSVHLSSIKVGLAENITGTMLNLNPYGLSTDTITVKTLSYKN